MRLLPSPWRSAVTAAVLAMVALLPGCKSKSSSNGESAATLTVKGKVTYTRVPLAFDANGVPLGLETDSSKFQTLPARGISLHFYKSVQETAPDGSKVTVWQSAAPDTYTDSTGAYSASVPANTPVFVELASLSLGTRIIADPAGINSSLNQAVRPLYLLRKGLDGGAAAGNPTPGSSASGDVTVDFSVGLQDKWWIGLSLPTQLSAATQESAGTGSRVLGILDSIYTWKSTYGRESPEDAVLLDLHYVPGRSEPRGTFVEYDKTVYPQSFDGLSLRYFGSIRGASSNDDAWDEGVLFPLFARNFLSHRWNLGLPLPGAKLPHLKPDLALFEGFVDAMAANLLKSPYLADSAGAGATFRDIRDLSGLDPSQKSPYSAPAIAALSWELVLKGNSLPSPGTPANWATINPLALLRYFTPILPRTSDNLYTADSFNVFSQVGRLSEAKLSSEPVDLASIFPASVLTPMLAPFGITWPRPTTLPLSLFLTDWGSDPNSATTAFAPVTLTMANAAALGGSYPNASEGELAYARFLVTKDTAFAFSVQTQPAVLPAGTRVEVFFPNLPKTFTFSGTSAPQRLPFTGTTTAPAYQWVRIRVLSPGQVAPDIQVAVQLVPVS